MKHTIKTLILSSLFALNLMGSAPAPEQLALELTPSEIEYLSNPDWRIRYTIKNITNRGIDPAKLGAYLAHDERFREAYDRTFTTFEPAIELEDLPLFEYVLTHHPDAINKKYYKGKGNSPLNKVLKRIEFHHGDATPPDLRTMVKLLVNHGADKESHWYYFHEYFGTPLLQAVDMADYDIVAFLVAKGADVNAKNYKGQTALEMARGMRKRSPHVYDKIIALLENYKTPFIENAILQRGLPQKGITQDIGAVIAGYVTGGEASSKQTKAKRTALNAVKEGLKNNTIEPLEDFMAQYPKDLNAHDETGDSLLLLAVKAKNVAAVTLILEKLTQLDAAERTVNDRLAKALGHRNIRGKNAYDLAQEIKDEEIIELLRPYYNAPEMAPMMEQ